MAYPEVLIPPSVKPESPYEPQLLDEQTTPFVPRFGRGQTQRQVWGDPLLGVKLRYQALAAADRALMRSAMLNVKGKGANVRWTPGLPLLGSFPATELLTNNDFSNGTTGWTGGNATLTNSNRSLRLKNTKASGAAAFYVTQTGLTVTQYAPYALRSFISAVSRAGMSNGNNLEAVTNYATGQVGMVTTATVALAGTTGLVYAGLFDSTGQVAYAGDYGELTYTSLARCMQVDNGANELLASDAINDASWNKTAGAVTANFSTAPDGTSTADRFVPTATLAHHYFHQNATVSSSALDYCAYGFFKDSGYGFVRLQLEENTSGTNAYQIFNLATGAVGSTAVTGANWTNRRAYIVSAGDGWYFCAVIARKTNAATSILALASSSATDSAATWTADGSNGLLAWRVGISQSSVPTRGGQTASTTLPSGTPQSGGQINVKGLPASTLGLLVTGDWFEINGELKQVTSDLDSDAVGLGTLQFRPGLWRTPADNDPVIILNPMGRFMLASDPRITERYGVYTGFELDLVECPA